jgi:hypothetical protein
MGIPARMGRLLLLGKNGASGSYPTDGVKFSKLGTMIFTSTGDNAYYGYKIFAYPHPLRNEGLFLSLIDTYTNGSFWTIYAGKLYTYFLSSAKYGGKNIKKVTQNDTELVKQVSIDLCESTKGSYFLNSTDGTLYMHSTNDADPDTHTIDVYYF